MTKRTKAAVLLAAAAVYAVRRVWSAAVLAPWAFVGQGSPDYFALLLFC
jgi:hypothetical protein